eukprot:296969-Pelagomonas_calceolata.AAC.1
MSMQPWTMLLALPRVEAKCRMPYCLPCPHLAWQQTNLIRTHSYLHAQDLAVGLTASGGKGQDALLPAVSTSGMTAPQRARLQQALSSVVLPVLGGPHSPAQATDLAGDKLRWGRGRCPC